MKVSCNCTVNVQSAKCNVLDTSGKSRPKTYLVPSENQFFDLLVVLSSITELNMMYFLWKIFPPYFHLR